MVGLVPVVGEPLDGINGVWYAAEGDYLNAGLSAAAMVPIVGWGATGGKIVTRATRTAGTRAVRPAVSAVSGRNLARSLASDSQTAGPGLAIIGAGTARPLRSAERLAADFGGRPEDWAKMSSPSYTGVDGRKFETHWYENVVTGERVEFKTKRLN